MIALLIQTLARLYPDREDWKRLTSLAGLNFSYIVAGTSAINFWHAAVHEAVAQRTILKLAETAFTEYPQDEHLAQLYAFYEDLAHAS